ncbi:HlyC/CorC family transporter [Phytoactinopolyspora alkaliphila]|uniref:HlyC/CorC family transporter n=2 Tax=Phytoactinopolyspora alkaliphila TaxID=1783498 RepID=A0A6N9YJ88_9ACTN|nr:hemolysin family protein [Phytoactinopolyspora alkaliphila]NED95053.1 HlyC/CorC family transporter [Phytoactinopolyspora alkaliphila]
MLVSAGLVLLFVLIGGVFAATELALVALRESQLEHIAQQGKRGARAAALARNPNRFLSAVQIGVTLAGFFSAAYGASALAPEIAPTLESAGLSGGLASTVAFIGVTVLIAYLSLVLGELVPKRIALQRAEGVARVVAAPLDRFATLMRPVIWLLSASTDVVVRLLGGDPGARREEMSDEELRELVAAHKGLSDEERRIVEDVFAVGDRQLREVMLPRTEVDFLGAGVPVEEAITLASRMPHSRYPVFRDSVDDVVGFVHVRDLYEAAPSTRDIQVGELAREVLVLPGTKRVLPALSEMRRQGAHLAIVVDEYGGTAGIATLEDLVEELVGEIWDEYDEHHAEEDTGQATAGGVAYVDGLLNIEDFADETGVNLPEGPYETVAGYLVSRLGRLPEVGDVVDVGDARLEVLALDGRRVSRLRVHAEFPGG